MCLTMYVLHILISLLRLIITLLSDVKAMYGGPSVPESLEPFKSTVSYVTLHLVVIPPNILVASRFREIRNLLT